MKQSLGRKRTAAAIRWKPVRRNSCSSPLNRKSQPLTRGGAVKKKSCLSPIGDARRSSGAVSALDKSLRLRFSGLRFLLDGWTPRGHLVLSPGGCRRLQLTSLPEAGAVVSSLTCFPSSPSLAASSGPFFFFFFQTSARVTKLQTESQLASTAGAVTK